MYCISVVIVFSLCFVANTSANIEKHVKTIHGNEDPPLGSRSTYVFNAEYEYENKLPSAGQRLKRAAGPTTDGITTKINHLNDTHKQLMVHWVGAKSNVVVCLARDPAVGLESVDVNPSAVYISYNDGDTYENKTDSFKMSNGSYATLEKFYNHPKYNTHFVFTDIRHNLLFVTRDHGKQFNRLELPFTPSDVSFHEYEPGTFVVLDKNDTNQKLWITEDFGKHFRLAEEFVRAFYWMKNALQQMQLIIQRYEPNGLSSVLTVNDLFKTRTFMLYMTSVKDLFIKGDYVFTTKTNEKGDLEMYVSYKMGKRQLCIFNSVQKFNNYYVVDVTGNRAFIAISHSDRYTNLYVSENLRGDAGEVKFTLSLEDVFAYFPNSTWQETWLHHVSEEAFADVYKVEGLSGIYIASKLISKFIGNPGPQHLGSVITFDHGATWRPIQPPLDDVEGQNIGCNNCSLHLSQKFSQLHPETRSVSILSSKSAPGIIVATGVIGRNLKGHHGVYVSLDAGLTWRQTLRELFFFNMGDHGGILTAVKFFKAKGETRHILYSLDEGEHWNMTVFHNEELRVYGLMTDPGENRTVFTMFGSLPDVHQWMIVKVDFRNVFKRVCTELDYKHWSPSQSEENRNYIPCVLGEQTTYQRRMTHSLCLNGLDYVRLISKQACDCDVLDYECDFGFMRVGNPPRCIRYTSLVSYDPYKVPDNCKRGQFYNRTKGYRKISGDHCIGGFELHYLPDSIPCPFEETNDFILFAQRERISRFNLITMTLEELPVKNLKNVIAIDFDMSMNCVYWADIALDTIGRQCFANGSKEEVLVSTDLSSIEGMAFDWISKTLYFVDGVLSKIELIRTDINHSGRMRRTILNSTVLNKPRGIAVHPQNGYMFWTDWSAENPSVNRANLDGTNNMTLFDKEKVEWPNGITIDYIANRIYWVDAKKDYIGSSDLHGEGFIKIISNIEVVTHPFAIAVFKNNMYWDDWKRNSIFSADKDTFRGLQVIVKQLPGMMDLKIFAHGVQIGTNACANSSCPYICVGLPKNKHACLCPDGLVLKNGKCMCPGDVQPLANLTCPAVGNSCGSDHFTCGNGLCIPKGWRCDDEDDCGDNSDELQCGFQTCPPLFFSCEDGKCLPHYWKCDYDSDCADGSDEKDCPRQNCTEGQFSCENGRCISSKWRCDGENDCRDGSDERNCSPDSPSSCKNDEFQCQSGAIKCIPSTWKCDDEPDCRDSSDEINCNNNTCTENQFACGPPNNRCIYNTWVCDGDKDCPDGLDEKDCPSGRPEIPKTPDGFLPKNETCQDWMFQCKNDRCIPVWWKCDGADDCTDNSDEEGCFNVDIPSIPETSTSKPVICENNQYQCATGTCIFSSWVCDGMFDCPGGEDEANCNIHINCTQFKCRIDGSCIPLSAVCNGIFDCPDATDEFSCEHNLPNGPATPSCSTGLFPCDGGSCHPLAVLCDGKVDCKDGYDESNCTLKTRVYQVMQMSVDERGINDTSLLLYWWIPIPSDVELEFLPAISKVGSNNNWQNTTWSKELSHEFSDLEPFTKYNMTVYVRTENTNNIFPPAKYFISSTSEGIPSPPWNVTARQYNGSHTVVSWEKPLHPNGIIINYEVSWTSRSSGATITFPKNGTIVFIQTGFQHNETYTFRVIAYNRKYASSPSLPAKMLFDGVTNLTYVRDLVVQNETDESISLAWKYDGIADGFYVYCFAATSEFRYSYSRKTTNTTNITMTLAPGEDYYFQISAFKSNLTGPFSEISANTTGTPLPKINTPQAILTKQSGTTVKLSWERPKYSRKLNWVYGVYYGIKGQQLFLKEPMLKTTNETATITNLDPCETYIFTVGLVGPIGIGPLSTNFKQVSTSMNVKAAPKKVRVEREGVNPLRMKVQWEPSCPSTQPDFYVVKVTEKSTTQTWQVKIHGTSLSHVFNVTYGGIYNVSVATIQFNATYSKPVTYYAPPILPPFEISVIPEATGRFLVYWQERQLPLSTAQYWYEVLVSPGNTLNESTAERHNVSMPPFVYTNLSSSTYTFAVRIKTKKGFESVISEPISMRQEEKQEQDLLKSSTNLPAIIVPSLLVLIALVAVITFLVIRNRRLQSSFRRYTSSHYDTRSEAATFDDNGLEEEESPQIQGFADDEPLVIA